jgi:hemerythrin
MDLKFKWKDEYCLGNDTIDAEHKKLFDIANKVFSTKTSEFTLDEIKNILNQLFDYVRYHFKHEEEYMKEISSGELDYQKEKHAEIISEMNTMLKETKGINMLELKLAYIMQKWVLVHIIEDDMKITNSPVTSEANGDFRY